MVGRPVGGAQPDGPACSSPSTSMLSAVPLAGDPEPELRRRADPEVRRADVERRRSGRPRPSRLTTSWPALTSASSSATDAPREVDDRACGVDLEAQPADLGVRQLDPAVGREDRERQVAELARRQGQVPAVAAEGEGVPARAAGHVERRALDRTARRPGSPEPNVRESRRHALPDSVVTRRTPQPCRTDTTAGFVERALLRSTASSGVATDAAGVREARDDRERRPDDEAGDDRRDQQRRQGELGPAEDEAEADRDDRQRPEAEDVGQDRGVEGARSRRRPGPPRPRAGATPQ